MSDDVKNVNVGEKMALTQTHLFYDCDLLGNDAGAETVERSKQADVSGETGVADGPSVGGSGAAGGAGETIGDVTKSGASVAQSEVGKTLAMAGVRGSQFAI